jgi:hypothetical protein
MEAFPKEEGVQMLQDTRRFWLGWTLATLAGYAAGILALLPWAINAAYAAQPVWITGLVSGAVVGGTLGIAQWLVLRRDTEVNLWWVVASIVGGMVGLALGMFVSEMITLPSAVPATREAARQALAWRPAMQAAIAGALLGLTLGAAQWLVLQRWLRYAGWWIIVNGVAWMVGLGAGAAIAERATLIGALIVTGVIAAVITGFTMQEWQWLMRKQRRSITSWA